MTDLYVTASGIVIPDLRGQRRAWIKLKGEPAIILVEIPEVVMERWLRWRQSSDPFTVFHELSFGYPHYFFRPAIEELCFVADTFKDAGQTRSGGIYAGGCSCPVCTNQRGRGLDPLRVAMGKSGVDPGPTEVADGS